MKELCLEIVTYLRCLEMAYIHTHHQVKGPAFFADHEAAGNFYAAVGLDADAASERFIGLFGAEELKPSYWKEAAEYLQEIPQSGCQDLWMHVLKKEKHLIELVEELCSKLPRESDKQLYSGIGDKAIARTYLLKQRLKEA